MYWRECIFIYITPFFETWCFWKHVFFTFFSHVGIIFEIFCWVLKEIPQEMMMPNFNFQDMFYLEGEKVAETKANTSQEMMKKSVQHFAMKGAGFLAILDRYIYIYKYAYKYVYIEYIFLQVMRAIHVKSRSTSAISHESCVIDGFIVSLSDRQSWSVRVNGGLIGLHLPRAYLAYPITSPFSFRKKHGKNQHSSNCNKTLVKRIAKINLYLSVG